MKDKINKFTNNRFTINILILVFLFILFIISSTIFFQSYKNKLINDNKLSTQLDIKYLNSKLDLYILNYKKDRIINEINFLFKNKTFESFIIKNTRYLFNEDTLFENTNNIEDKSWNIAEVVVDAKYGYVQKVSKSNLYEFVPTKNFDFTKPVVFRYQLFNKGNIKNLFAEIDFSGIEFKSNTKTTKSLFMDFFIDLKTSNSIYDLKLDNKIVSTVIYKYNNTDVIKNLESFLLKLILSNVVLLFPAIFVLIFYHKFLFKKYVTQPITYINSYLNELLNNRFTVLDRTKFEETDEIKDLTKKITKVATKIVSLENDLNINKESLELKSSIDTLTGLPNKSIFDFDIKTMYVSKTKAYIFVIKMDKLSEISKIHDSGYVNNFIESYTNTIRNVIFKYSKTDMKLYRFHGSQFAVIAKNIEIETAQEMCEKIIDEITEFLPVIYDVPDSLVQIGGTFFDLYGSLDTVTKLLDGAYKKSQENGINSYYIIGSNDIEKNQSLLNNSVKEVIEKENFTIRFTSDSFLFDDPEKLIMSEASPLIYDHNNKMISIGSLVSIAQKLKIVEKFDKIVIEKVIDEIRQKEFRHEIAINLSMDSIRNEEFIKWLEFKLNENKDIKKYIVFSLTSYSAYSQKNIFEEFIKKVHELGAKVILKRYKTDEYPLKELEFIQLDYIRMYKDYTINFTNNIVKKHKVKDILIFAELNNIKVLADSVKIDSDYDFLERLGTYGTSR